MGAETNTKESSSRFLLNLIAQGAIAYVLTYFSYAAMLGGSEIVQILATLRKLLYCSFFFGVAYGFFRLLGVKGGPVELYYQNFPFGFSYRNQETRTIGSTPTSTPSSTAKFQKFDWDKLFSAEYLRYAGMLLIVSAIFSLLFRVEWSLLHKLIASYSVAIVTIVGAEIVKIRGAKVLPAYLFLCGAAAFQFAVTLTGSYLVENQLLLASELVSPLLSLKLLVCVLMLPLLARYRADFSAGIYFTILYFAPLSLTFCSFTVTLVEMTWFIATATIIILTFAYKSKAEGLPLLNCIAANLLLFFAMEERIGMLWARSTVAKFPEEINFALACLLIVYLLHLTFTIVSEVRHGISTDSIRCFNVFVSHIFLLLGLLVLVPFVNVLNGEMGIVLLIASLFPFASYLLLLSLDRNSFTQEGLLQSAIILATIGLFLETNGPWSALVFLLYACGILWFALIRKQRTIRIFAFFVLTASLIKLYTECFELFDSISGATAILLVGGLLLLLSNKMEKIKELIRD